MRTVIDYSLSALSSTLSSPKSIVSGNQYPSPSPYLFSPPSGGTGSRMNPPKPQDKPMIQRPFYSPKRSFYHQLGSLIIGQIFSQLGLDKYSNDKMHHVLGTLMTTKLEKSCRVLKRCFEFCSEPKEDLFITLSSGAEDVEASDEISIHPGTKLFLNLELGDMTGQSVKDILWYLQEQNHWINHIMNKLVGESLSLKGGKLAQGSLLAPQALLSLFNTLPGKRKPPAAGKKIEEPEQEKEKVQVLKGFEDFIGLLPPIPSNEYKIEKENEKEKEKGRQSWERIKETETNVEGGEEEKEKDSVSQEYKERLISVMNILHENRRNNPICNVDMEVMMEEVPSTSLLDVELKPVHSPLLFSKLPFIHSDSKFLTSYFTKPYDPRWLYAEPYKTPSTVESLYWHSIDHFELSISKYWLTELTDTLEGRKSSVPAIHFTWRTPKLGRRKSAIGSVMDPKLEIVITNSNNSSPSPTSLKLQKTPEDSWEGLENPLTLTKKKFGFPTLIKPLLGTSMGANSLLRKKNIPKIKLVTKKVNSNNSTSSKTTTSPKGGYKIKLPHVANHITYKKKLPLLKLKPLARSGDNVSVVIPKLQLPKLKLPLLKLKRKLSNNNDIEVLDEKLSRGPIKKAKLHTEPKSNEMKQVIPKIKLSLGGAKVLDVKKEKNNSSASCKEGDITHSQVLAPPKIKLKFNIPK